MVCVISSPFTQRTAVPAFTVIVIGMNLIEIASTSYLPRSELSLGAVELVADPPDCGTWDGCEPAHPESARTSTDRPSTPPRVIFVAFVVRGLPLIRGT